MSSKTTNKSNTHQQTNQTQTTTPTLDPRIAPYYNNIADLTNNAINSVDRTPWTGPAVAGVNQFDNRAILDASGMLSALSAQRTPGQFTGLATDAASGRLLDPATNPTLRANVDAATSHITRQLERQIIPGIDNAAIMDNAFGGDRAAMTRGVAYGDWARASGEISAQMYADNYNRERAYQMQAPELYQQAINAEMAIPQLYSQLGEQQRMLDQIPINDQIMQRALQEQIAFGGLAQGASILNSLPFVGQTSSGQSTMTGTSTDTTTTKQNPLTSIVQGGLGIGSMMAGLGWAPFAGQAIGGAMGTTGVGAGGLGTTGGMGGALGKLLLARG